MESHLARFFWALLFASAVSVLSFRMKFLTAGGSFAQLLLGWALLGLGGWKWTVPILFFFLSSSLLSLLAARKKSVAVADFAKGGSRDALQVLANGGVSGILVILDCMHPLPIWYPMSLGSIAAATADTWGTEVGLLSRSQPILVTTFVRVQPGTSGAISILGSLAGALGAAVTASIGWLWTPGQNTLIASAVIFSGIFSSLIDSLIGASLQAKFQCPSCLKITEKENHCGICGNRVDGIAWLTNDVVNLASTLTGACIVLVAIRLGL
jgi:uncharacterized protein (TIGR00297 family)